MIVKTRLIPLLASLWSPAATVQRNGADPSVNAAIDKGTFENPSVQVRPKFRYWIPDASVDPSILASDVKSAGDVGAAGLEALGYYLYGGPPANNGIGMAAPVSWATYGFGTEAWNSLFKALVQAHKDNNLIVDFAIGPNQGTGVPSPSDSSGLMWDIVAYNVSVPIGGSFNGTLPGWGTGSLEAAITARVTKSEFLASISPGLPGDIPLSRTQITIAESSLKDVTSQVDADGQLEVSFDSDVEGLNHTIFAIYLIHSLYRAQDGPKDLGGPQTAAQSLAQNGSWAVDHFSELGARTITQFWEQHILQNGTRELLMEVGNYGWEDSVEIEANVFWTENMSSLFEADHGYSISKWLPILFHRNGHAKDSNPPVWWVTDEPDAGLGRIADYRRTLTAQYHRYLAALSTWAEDYLGVGFSAQISYNMPMDMLANIPTVDAPECPANFAGRRIVSSECGAVKGEAFAQTLPELLWHVKRSFAGSINQFVFHGFPYSGNYGNTTWPVFTTFDYQFSNMHGPHEPAWDYYRDQIDYVARNNFILQSGTPKRDIAFWQKVTTYPGHVTTRTYEPSDLERHGYTYEYLSPDNFVLSSAVVENGVLAPESQAFRALIVRANDSLTIEGVAKLVDFAYAGLPTIFSGGIPTSYLGTNNADSLAASQQSLNQTILLDNVLVTDSYDGLASTLSGIGILPSTQLSTNGSWFTLWRSDEVTGEDYVFVYNDAVDSPAGEGSSKGVIEFNSTSIPYEFNAWTGEQSPILIYTRSDSSTFIPLQLAGNQSTIVAFLKKPLDQSLHPAVHFNAISDEILSVSPSGNGSIVLKVGPSASSSPSYTTADGESHIIPSVQLLPITIDNWTLTVEHWDPPTDLFNIESGAIKYNTTHHIPSLVSWQDIDGLQDVSGRGYYSATFQWPPPSDAEVDGAFIDFGPVVHTLRASVNGHLLPPLDVTSAKADIKDALVNGENTVEAVVATPLGNVLRKIWDQLQTSGTGPTDLQGGGPPPPVADYGLLKDVIVTPYQEVIV